MPTELERALVSAGHARDFEEAKQIRSQMMAAVAFENQDPEEVLMEYNLEPDYIFDLL